MLLWRTRPGMALPHTSLPSLSSATVQSMPEPCMQVPTDIIERNIKRASESKSDYAEVSGRGQAAMLAQRRNRRLWAVGRVAEGCWGLSWAVGRAAEGCLVVNQAE